jgi:hypothetical protein
MFHIRVVNHLLLHNYSWRCLISWVIRIEFVEVIWHYLLWHRRINQIDKWLLIAWILSLSLIVFVSHFRILWVTWYTVPTTNNILVFVIKWLEFIHNKLCLRYYIWRDLIHFIESVLV